MPLNLVPAEPKWLDILPGARIHFAPITIKAVRAARRAVAAALHANVDDIEEAGDEMSRELLRRGILEWEGFGDADGAPIAVSADAIELLLADPTAFEAADRAYVRPWADRELEKNGYAGSPNGTSKAATPAPDTVSSAAAPPAASDAGLMPTPAKGRSARTSSTSSRPRKPKKSGRSSRAAPVS